MLGDCSFLAHPMTTLGAMMGESMHIQCSACTQFALKLHLKNTTTHSLTDHILPTTQVQQVWREARLTRHTVDSFQRSQDADSTDCRQVNVLEIQGVLHHPVEGKREKRRRKFKRKIKHFGLSHRVIICSLKGFCKS